MSAYEEYNVRIYPDGTEEWRKNGMLHRKNGPAITGLFVECYCKYGKFHREKYPAVIWKDGLLEWYLDDKRHREDGRPAVIWSDGTKEYWVNGLRHRVDGPAIEYASGEKYWFLNGKEVSKEEVESLTP